MLEREEHPRAVARLGIGSGLPGVEAGSPRFVSLFTQSPLARKGIFLESFALRRSLRRLARLVSACCWIFLQRVKEQPHLSRDLRDLVVPAAAVKRLRAGIGADEATDGFTGIPPAVGVIFIRVITPGRSALLVEEFGGGRLFLLVSLLAAVAARQVPAPAAVRIPAADRKVEEFPARHQCRAGGGLFFHVTSSQRSSDSSVLRRLRDELNSLAESAGTDPVSSHLSTAASSRLGWRNVAANHLTTFLEDVNSR